MANTTEPITAALLRAHKALIDDLQKLEESADPVTMPKLTDLRSKLDATRTHVTEHFRFEEQNGYMDEVRKREPRFERAIQHLAAEHRHLAQSLETLIGAAKTAASLDETLRDAVRRWVNDVQQHEIRENDLVQDAFDQDIGGED